MHPWAASGTANSQLLAFYRADTSGTANSHLVPAVSISMVFVDVQLLVQRLAFIRTMVRALFLFGFHPNDGSSAISVCFHPNEGSSAISVGFLQNAGIQKSRGASVPLCFSCWLLVRIRCRVESVVKGKGRMMMMMMMMMMA